MKYAFATVLFASMALATPALNVRADACLDACEATDNACRSAPGANLSTCASEKASCDAKCPTLTSTPIGRPTHDGECQARCSAADDECRGKPDANQATCSAELAACDASCSTTSHSSPIGVPTHDCNPDCRKVDEVCIEKCKATENECRTKPGANQSTCSSDYAGCEAACPVSTMTHMPGPHPTPNNDCLLKCSDEEDKCRVAPDANQATCSANKAGCDAKCHAGTMTHMPGPYPTPDNDCSAKCSFEEDECRGAPDANQATCSANKAECDSTCPARNNNGTTPIGPIPVAAGDRTTPVVAMLAAMGLAALV